MQTVDQIEAQEEVVELSDYEKERGKPMPNISHSLLEMRLGARFLAQAAGRYLIAPELSVEFADKLTLTPDISVLPQRQIDWVREPVHCQDLPILVVEILSPSQGYMSVVEKIDAYFVHGVQSVWQVNPALRLIAIYQPGVDKPEIIQRGEAKDPVTGLSVHLEDLFA